MCKFLLEVQKGDTPQHKMWYGIGERENIKNKTGEDLWRGNELKNPPDPDTDIPIPDPSGEFMSVVSESNNDIVGGTGVQEVIVLCLDENGFEKTVKVILNGTTPVPILDPKILFINEIYASKTGSGHYADGNIFIHKTGDPLKVYSMIAKDQNISCTSQKMVPKGKKLYIKGWNCSAIKGNYCIIRILSTNIEETLIPGVFINQGTCFLSDGPSGEIDLNVSIPSLSIVKVKGWAKQNNALASVVWWGILVG